MVTPLNLATDSRDDGSFVLRATGELDLSNVEAFSETLASARKAVSDHQLSVDLSGVDYLDSGAISDHADGIQIVVNPILLPVLTISGLTEVTTVRTATP